MSKQTLEYRLDILLKKFLTKILSPVHFVGIIFIYTMTITVETRQVSSKIHSAWPTVSPVANMIFVSFCLLDFEMWGRTTCAKTVIPTGRDYGSAEWINYWAELQDLSLTL